MKKVGRSMCLDVIENKKEKWDEILVVCVIITSQNSEYIILIKVRGFSDETAQDLMLLLTEEVGELAKEVRKVSTNIKMDVTSKKTIDVELELADVFSYVLALARFYDINLIDAFKRKEEKNMKRIWE